LLILAAAAVCFLLVNHTFFYIKAVPVTVSKRHFFEIFRIYMVVSSIWPDIRLFSVPVSGRISDKSNPVSGRIPDIKKCRIIRPDVWCIPVRTKTVRPGLWIRIGSGFSDFVDPDPHWESGSWTGSRGKKIKKFQWEMHFLVIF
jgi:hypothetical protein